MLKLEVNWSQNSTIKGAIWLTGGVIGILFAWVGKDPTYVMLVASSVAGGFGVAVSD